MSLLAAHLEQISVSCHGIDSLPYLTPSIHVLPAVEQFANQLSFPPPKIFTNALLSNHDITSLIRDTEAHERALFSVPPPAPPTTSQNPDPPKTSRRQTVFNVAAGEVTTGPPTSRSTNPRRNTAVAAVLGGDLHAQIVRRTGGEKGDVDIEVLLRGAEKLCGVYPLPGAAERIRAQRQKWAHQSNTLAYYEAKVSEQSEALGRMNKDHWRDDDEETADDAEGGNALTEDDLRREEEEARELDKKKRELQERLRAMDKDLGGLLNM